MKVLFVVPSFPLPANSGGQIATLETLRSLQSFCRIHLLAPPPEAGGEADETELRRLFPDIQLHSYRALDQGRSLGMYKDAVLTAVMGRSYWQASWKNPSLRIAVEHLHAAERYDVVHCEWLQPAVSLRGLDLPLLIRTLDVHFLDMERWADSMTGLRRSYWRAQAKRFRRFEASTLVDAQTVVTVSAEDQEILRACGVDNTIVIPPPRTLEAPGPDAHDGLPLALFLGRMEMTPNRDAFFFFADRIWPQVNAEVRKRMRVIFAGGSPGDDILRHAHECGIELQSSLSDSEAKNLLGEAQLFLSPVTSGTGIKVKTLDAMTHGKAMIGFRGAFRGVPVQHGVHAMIANDSADFARLLEQLIDDEPRRKTIGNAGRELIRAHFDPAILGERLAGIYAHVAQMSNP